MSFLFRALLRGLSLSAFLLASQALSAQPSDGERKILESYPPSTVEMQLQQVSEHVYVAIGQSGMASDNQGFISNAAAVIGDDAIVIFDALGTPSLARMFVERIREISDAPIRRVIVSHYHADHIYGLQLFRELGAEIWAPAAVQVYLEAEYAQERLDERRFTLDPWVNDSTQLLAPDRYLEADEQFELGGLTFQINLLGTAHSDGDLALLVEDDRVLLSGDIIFEGRVPYVGDANTRTWLATLEQLETSHLAALVPGHGPPAAEPDQTIALTRRYLARLRAVFGTAVEDLQSFDEAFSAADWSEFAALPTFDLSHRRNAYQVFLSLEAEQLGD